MVKLGGILSDFTWWYTNPSYAREHVIRDLNGLPNFRIT